MSLWYVAKPRVLGAWRSCRARGTLRRLCRGERARYVTTRASLPAARDLQSAEQNVHYMSQESTTISSTSQCARDAQIATEKDTDARSSYFSAKCPDVSVASINQLKMIFFF